MKTFNTVDDLRRASLLEDQIVWVGTPTSSLSAYEVRNSGNGELLENGKTAVYLGDLLNAATIEQQVTSILEQNGWTCGATP